MNKTAYAICLALLGYVVISEASLQQTDVITTAWMFLRAPVEVITGSGSYDALTVIQGLLMYVATIAFAVHGATALQRRARTGQGV